MMKGSRFKHFLILEQVGRGGMGEVFLAQDQTLERKVALKFLPRTLTGDPAAQGRLLDEARSCSRVQHPNVAVVHSIEEDGGIFAICMEYVEGKTLKELAGSRLLPMRKVVAIGIGVAEGLHAAHEHTVIHRDLKPANVILTPRGEVKVMDFGLALRPARTVETAGPESFGTVAYMSPEQAKGAELDPATDIFSFGSTLYELLTGKLPFEGENDLVVLQKILGDEPVPIRELRRDVPPALDRIVRVCMEKDKQRRYATMAAVAEDLRQVEPLVEHGPKDLILELASGLRDDTLTPSKRREPESPRLSPNVSRTPPAAVTADTAGPIVPSSANFEPAIPSSGFRRPPPPPGHSASGRGASARASRGRTKGEKGGSRPAPEAPKERTARTPRPPRPAPPAEERPKRSASATRPRPRPKADSGNRAKVLLGLLAALAIAALGIFALGRMGAQAAKPSPPGAPEQAADLAPK